LVLDGSGEDSGDGISIINNSKAKVCKYYCMHISVIFLKDVEAVGKVSS
jgi:hypothetical protein